MFKKIPASKMREMLHKLSRNETNFEEAPLFHSALQSLLSNDKENRIPNSISSAREPTGFYFKNIFHGGGFILFSN